MFTYLCFVCVCRLSTSMLEPPSQTHSISEPPKVKFTERIMASPDSALNSALQWDLRLHWRTSTWQVSLSVQHVIIQRSPYSSWEDLYSIYIQYISCLSCYRSGCVFMWLCRGTCRSSHLRLDHSQPQPPSGCHRLGKENKTHKCQIERGVTVRQHLEMNLDNHRVTVIYCN